MNFQLRSPVQEVYSFFFVRMIFPLLHDRLCPCQAKLYPQWFQEFQAPAIFLFHRLSVSHNGFIGDICCLKTRQSLSTWPMQSLFFSQLPEVKERAVCESILRKGAGMGERGWRGLISHSQLGSGQTISGIQLPCTSHLSVSSSSSSPGPLLPAERPFMGLATGRGHA